MNEYFKIIRGLFLSIDPSFFLENGRVHREGQPLLLHRVLREVRLEIQIKIL